MEYRDSWITSAVGGLAFSEISGDKKGPESGLGGGGGQSPPNENIGGANMSFCPPPIISTT